jgi:methionyl-tRNA formyltransferase
MDANKSTLYVMTESSSTPRIVYAGNRKIGISCLQELLAAGIVPVALMVPEVSGDTTAMQELLPHVPCFVGKESLISAMRALPALKPDYLLSIHYPLILPEQLLRIPAIGTLNLHPAYLPWNRGWHTPSWAILDDTPYGATLHWVDNGLDTGPIALQAQVKILPTDTADSLYKKALALELDVFKEAVPLLKTNALPKVPQTRGGTTHKKADLEAMRKLDPKTMSTEEMDKRIRALTTNIPNEAAYIEENGERILKRAS